MVELDGESVDAQVAAASAAAAASAPTRDPKPKARKRKEPSGAEKARKRREREAGAAADTPPAPATIKALERGLARTLTAPALPAAMLPLPLDTKLFMLGHFTQAGPATAKQLAQAAEQSPELRELLERANKGSATLTLLMAGVIYLAPVVLWTLGQREVAAMASALASADPDELAAQAEAVQGQMGAELERMMAANGNGAEHPGAESPEHQGPAGPEPQAEPPPAV